MDIKNKVWYEKYRQTDLKKLSFDKATRNKMQEFIKDKEIPHLLFTGPPGSGKTTLAHILIDHCASSVLELNGSSKDRGIDTIKVRVADFAKSMRRDMNKKNIVFFDEADGLTQDAQKALKNTIEQYSNNTRFIFTANQFELINEAIYSRCMHFSFQTIPKKKLIAYYAMILDSEDINYKEKDLKFIVNKFYPDARTILNNLQFASIKGTLSKKALINQEVDLKILLKLINSGNVGKIRELWKNINSFKWLWSFLMDKYLPELDNNKIKTESALSIADYMNRSNTSIDQEINAIACIIDLIYINEGEIIF